VLLKALALMLDKNKLLVLLVDDTPSNLDVLKSALAATYSLKLAINGELALTLAAKFKPDIILLDIMMPVMDGYEVCRRLKSNPETYKIPVIFITAMTETANEQKGFDLGAVDYISKPINPVLVKARVRSQLILANQQRETDRLVELRTKEIKQVQEDAIAMLGMAGHFNDTDTGVHIWRMAQYSGALAKAVGWDVGRTEEMVLAAAMHDTGKIAMPDDILKAPRALTEDEWVIMRSHCQVGYDILSKSQSPVFKLAAEVALSHHEKWDGSGYPHGLSGLDIAESGRIVSICDVFDALTMKRPYKEAWSVEKALAVLDEGAGRHFDPELLAAFHSIEEEILEIKAYWQTEEDNSDRTGIKRLAVS